MNPMSEGVLTLVPAGGRRCLYGKWFGTGPSRARKNTPPCPNLAETGSVYCAACNLAARARVQRMKQAPGS